VNPTEVRSKEGVGARFFALYESTLQTIFLFPSLLLSLSKAFKVVKVNR